MKHNFRIKKPKFFISRHKHVKCLGTKYKKLLFQYKNLKHNFIALSNISISEIDKAYKISERIINILILILFLVAIINLFYIFIK